jgi:alpha-tubulin suppressor-like RCC1 family protein
VLLAAAGGIALVGAVYYLAVTDPFGFGDTAAIRAIAAGNAHTCALKANGVIECWGQIPNEFRSQDDPLTLTKSKPVQLEHSSYGRPVALSAAGDGTCALYETESQRLFMRCHQHAAVPDRLTLSVFEDVTAFASGSRFACAVLARGSLTCGGRNSFGQLGRGTRTAREDVAAVPGLPDGVVMVALGGYDACQAQGGLRDCSPAAAHACAVTSTGEAWCWGSNSSGQLGNGSSTDSPSPVRVTSLNEKVAAISLGGEHSCVLTAAGTAKCWGSNQSGQLGKAAGPNSPLPANAEGISSRLTAIAAGGDHTCAITEGQRLVCWGANEHGQLGDGTQTSRGVPVEVSALQGVAAVALGQEHTCAVLSSGAARCWGNNDGGTLGDGTYTSRSLPADVKGLRAGSPSARLAAITTGVLLATAAGGLALFKTRRMLAALSGDPGRRTA